MDPVSMDQVKQITIIGTGLLGSSCGLALRAAGYGGRIFGVGRRLETARRAQELGCVDEGGNQLGPPVRDSQLVIIAIPLSRYEPLLRELAGFDHEGLVMTDVGSTKQRVGALVGELLPEPARFVGSHPMAGSEQQGPDAARADLFRGKPCVITPSPDADPGALDMVKSFWTLLGMKLICMGPEEHDQKVARISHLPHAVAALLLQLAAHQGGLELASTGFRDTTRVASGDPKIWLDIFDSNREAVVDAIDAFGHELDALRDLLVEGQDDRLLEFLRQNKQARDDWIGQL